MTTGSRLDGREAHDRAPVPEAQGSLRLGEEKAAMVAPKANTSPIHGLWALTNRDLRKWYTNPYQLIISLVQPVIWMGLFGKALNFSSFISSGAPPAA